MLALAMAALVGLGAPAVLWAAPAITEYVAGLSPGSEPRHVTAGPDGNLWFTEEANPDRIGRITPSGVITEFSAGLTPNGRPAGIAAGGDGAL